MFDAARDLVFTNSADGNTIMSGGYRISKILGGPKKKQRRGTVAQRFAQRFTI